MKRMTFLDVKTGDEVVRMLGGKIPMRLKVKSVTEQFIVTHGGWVFDRRTGVEEDEELGWGTRWGITGSYLVRNELSQA